MVTDRPPRGAARRAEYARSDGLASLEVPDGGELRARAAEIEKALAGGATAPVRAACAGFLALLAGWYDVPPPGVKVLAARPLRSREGYSSELFGDYDLQTGLIRVWMRTAVQKRVTSFGTFLSTLCHEFCHHLDRARLGLPSTYHTRGFYARTAVLYHAARGTPLKPLAWIARGDGSWQIDWTRMRSPEKG
ncbi:MAG: hypothetical protein KBD01_20070 [Acidobacteria bacterium]|nr:hypothetical protein [Acidobacteriota bacterium]